MNVQDYSVYWVWMYRLGPFWMGKSLWGSIWLGLGNFAGRIWKKK